MATPYQIETALSQVHDQPSFISRLLMDALGWPVTAGTTSIEDISYGWTLEELDALGLSPKLVSGQISQLQPMSDRQPWGIFLLEFKDPQILTNGHGMNGALRQLLRGLVPSRRRRDTQATWQADNLLFICSHSYSSFRFARFRTPNGRLEQAHLATFGWDPDEPARTACEFNLPALAWPDNSVAPEEWSRKWERAFDVESVTTRFYTEYTHVFETLQADIGKCNPSLSLSDIHNYTQLLLNRLLFLRFVERKGWLSLGGSRKYLGTMYQRAMEKGSLFYDEGLRRLFFSGLAQQHSEPDEWLGTVPFLNGGLFERGLLDERVRSIPNSAFESIVGHDGLLYHYNFTVEESTPLDVDVAVDPEMLGKVFEELVTGRHSSGSYYTPRPVVTFMCREAIKAHLACRTPISDRTLVALVDQHRVVDMTDSQAASVRAALQQAKIVDLACGSGAYLLGMLQELVAIYRALENPSLAHDPRYLYDLKLRIITQNLYGADIDPIAANTAMLRLWLSLAVEADEPLPLPNLDFKIEIGDSVLGRNPNDIPGVFGSFLAQVADGLIRLKERYVIAHGTEKSSVFAEIVRIETDLSNKLRDYRESRSLNVIDWRVQFAEVFADEREGGSRGFDIVITNPPYVRQELIGESKSALAELYGDAVDGKSDLYCYFYVRGLQLLRPGGSHVFVCSNSWLDVGYGGKLQRYLLKNSHVHAIYESAVERQFSTADVNTIISVITKGRPSDDAQTDFVSLRGPFVEALADPTLIRTVSRTRTQLWHEGLSAGESGHDRPDYAGAKWGAVYLRSPDIYAKLLSSLSGKLVQLKEIASIRRGITTGANEFFFLSRQTAEAYGIEGTYLTPALKSPKDSDRIWLGEDWEPVWFLFLCNKTRSQLKGTNAWKYIQYGESLGIASRPTCSVREDWWNVGARKGSLVSCNYLVDRVMRFYGSSRPFIVSDNFQEVHSEISADSLLLAANCSITQLCVNVLGRANFGGGLIKMQTYELGDIWLPDPHLLPVDVGSVVSSAGQLDIMGSDREALDSVVLESLALAASDGRNIREAMAELASTRAGKAHSKPGNRHSDNGNETSGDKK